MTEPKPSRGRNILVGILGVLACIAITLSASILWIHQVALNTDRYVTVISRVATDTQVVEEVGGRLADQIVDRVDDEFDIPRLVRPLLRDWIAEQIGAFMGTDVFTDAWAAANRVAHTAAVGLLRRDSPLDSSDGELSISVLPVVIVGLERLQETGILPDDLELPDPSDVGEGEVIREFIADRLGIDLPPDFGEVPLVRMSRLESVRQLVRSFDLITVIGVAVAVVLTALTVWLARDRRRAVMLLGLGTAAAVLVVQVITLILSQAVETSLADDGTPILAAIVGALISNLALALTVVLILGVIAAAGAVAMGRRKPEPAG